ncbi:hypothetical protein NXX78_16815 [Bacteroides fragilis]|nr:hypothetical protein [Bacteroides fragilis]
MAKASWCNVSPMSGSENGTFNNQCGSTCRTGGPQYDSDRHG